MHISLIRQRFNPYGGAERFMSRALTTLGNKNMQVSVIARQWEVIDKVGFISCDPFYLGRLWRDWGFARSACAQIAKLKPDLVQSHERISCCDVYRAGDGVHKVWLQQKRRTQKWWQNIHQSLSLYHWYVKAAEKRMFENPRLKAVICNSKMVREQIIQHFSIEKGKVHVIYNGVDGQVFNPQITLRNMEIRKCWSIPAEARVFLFLGSGFDRKGLMQVINAFHRLQHNGFLLVAGYDKNETTYQKEVTRMGLQSKVKFIGPQRDVIPCYAAADVLVLPTLYDPFPNVVLEALSCGLPVITSTQSGAAEIITQGQEGYVCDALDVDKINEFMETLSEKDNIETMGIKARQLAEKYDLESMGENLTDLYKKIVRDL